MRQSVFDMLIKLLAREQLIVFYRMTNHATLVTQFTSYMLPGCLQSVKDIFQNHLVLLVFPQFFAIYLSFEYLSDNAKVARSSNATQLTDKIHTNSTHIKTWRVAIG